MNQITYYCVAEKCKQHMEVTKFTPGGTIAAAVVFIDKDGNKGNPIMLSSQQVAELIAQLQK